MNTYDPIPEPRYGLFEQLAATFFIVGYHLLRFAGGLFRRDTTIG